MQIKELGYKRINGILTVSVYAYVKCLNPYAAGG